MMKSLVKHRLKDQRMWHILPPRLNPTSQSMTVLRNSIHSQQIVNLPQQVDGYWMHLLCRGLGGSIAPSIATTITMIGLTLAIGNPPTFATELTPEFATASETSDLTAIVAAASRSPVTPAFEVTSSEPVDPIAPIAQAAPSTHTAQAFLSNLPENYPPTVNLPQYLAQASVSDNCRRVAENADDALLMVRTEPSLGATGIDRLQPDDRVELVDNWESILDPYGYYWVEIDSPVRGYLANRHEDAEGYSTLLYCPGAGVSSSGYAHSTPAPAPAATVEPTPLPSYSVPAPRVTLDSYCQEVTTEEGLTIRARPSAIADRVGGITQGGRLIVAPDTQPLADADGRYWLAIVEPEEGYVAGGFSIYLENITPCES